ncbi:MAG: chemotaxis protein CheX [Phycisphaerales bacterium JB037]
MDPAFIAPFIASIKNVFSTMLQLPVTIGTPALKRTPNPTHEVSGIIGMSGAVVGTIVLSFERAGAVRLVELFAGQRFEPESPDFADAIGELVNMVSGAAKAKFDAGEVSISCPSVVVGPGHTVAVPSDTPVVCIPCATDAGSGVIEIAIKPAPVPVR